MALHPTSISKRAFTLAAVAMIGLGAVGYSPRANAQAQTASTTTSSATLSRGVSPADCAAFLKYVVKEAQDDPKVTGEFLATVLRFKRAGCQAVDKDGPIQIILENSNDAVAFRVARDQMSKVDILGISGVAGCLRAEVRDGMCPPRGRVSLLTPSGTN